MLATPCAINILNIKTVISLDQEKPVYDGIVCRIGFNWLLE